MRDVRPFLTLHIEAGKPQTIVNAAVELMLDEGGAPCAVGRRSSRARPLAVARVVEAARTFTFIT
jgi:hypothetical protein